MQSCVMLLLSMSVGILCELICWCPVCVYGHVPGAKRWVHAQFTCGHYEPWTLAECMVGGKKVYAVMYVVGLFLELNFLFAFP